jgi:hypothetical protein
LSVSIATQIPCSSSVRSLTTTVGHCIAVAAARLLNPSTISSRPCRETTTIGVSCPCVERLCRIRSTCGGRRHRALKSDVDRSVKGTLLGTGPVLLDPVSPIHRPILAVSSRRTLSN